MCKYSNDTSFELCVHDTRDWWTFADRFLDRLNDNPADIPHKCPRTNHEQTSTKVKLYLLTENFTNTRELTTIKWSPRIKVKNKTMCIELLPGRSYQRQTFDFASLISLEYLLPTRASIFLEHRVKLTKRRTPRIVRDFCLMADMHLFCLSARWRV